jgi:hypothetical protein
MYRTLRNIGNNVVEESCKGPEGPLGSSGSYQNTGSTGATGSSPPKNVIHGSLGVFSGDDEMPFNNGNLYHVSTSYRLMEDKGSKRFNDPSRIHFINQMGLHAMPDYRESQNAIGGRGYEYYRDGRVIDSARSFRMVLDQPANVGAVDMDQVSEFDNRNYGSQYRSYEDIKNGQIVYYIDKDTAQPFYHPVYTLPSYVDKTIRIDPMSSVRPEYTKTPMSSTLHHVSNDQATRDALSHREDIMSKQQNLYNQTSWTNRWVHA